MCYLNSCINYKNIYLQTVPLNPYSMYAGGAVAPVMMVPSTAGTFCNVRQYAPVQVYSQPPPQPVLQPIQLSEADLKMVII